MRREERWVFLGGMLVIDREWRWKLNDRHQRPFRGVSINLGHSTLVVRPSILQLLASEFVPGTIKYEMMHLTALKRQYRERRPRTYTNPAAPLSSNTWCMYSVASQRRNAFILRMKFPLGYRAACIALTDAVSTRPILSGQHGTEMSHDERAVMLLVLPESTSAVSSGLLNHVSVWNGFWEDGPRFCRLCSSYCCCCLSCLFSTLKNLL